jgi:transcription initiation factor TFIIIB Brf1 subunit/transcription initiation factor TFIIB
LPETKVQLQAHQIAEQACNRLNLPMDVLNAARHVAKTITEMQIITGKQPQTIAGVSIFIVSQLSTEKKSLSEIASAVNITEPTIKQAYKEVYDYRKQILPEWWKYKESIDSLQKM